MYFTDWVMRLILQLKIKTAVNCIHDRNVNLDFMFREFNGDDLISTNIFFINIKREIK